MSGPNPSDQQKADAFLEEFTGETSRAYGDEIDFTLLRVCFGEEHAEGFASATAFAEETVDRVRFSQSGAPMPW